MPAIASWGPLVEGPTVPVGAGPIGIAITPNGRHAYVANNGDSTVSVIDTAFFTTVATIPGLAGPVGVALGPSGTSAYVTNAGSGTVSVIDTATNTVTATITVGANPIGVAVTPDGSHIYVANNGDGTVSVIDTATDAVVGSPIPVGTNPAGAASSPDGSQIWVVNFGSNSVSAIDTATNTVTDTLTVGASPSRVAITPNGLSSYVTDNGANAVTVIEKLRAISPNAGPIEGGTVVTITGVNLAGATAVNFGPRQASVIADTANQLTVISPPGSGTVPVTVVTPGGTSNQALFQYVPAPTVTGIDPISGPIAGGTSATVSGIGLLTAHSVTFGATPARPTVVSDTQLTVTAPPGTTAGSVPVGVTTAGGTARNLIYTYLDAPTVTALSPGSGPVSGGTPITLTGTGLTTTNQVTLGGVPVAFNVISDTTLTLQSPPGTAGPANLTVTTSAGTATATYTYVPAPTT
ncbi:IPT/TIG domain-containing protein [Kitasatospora sp. NPDC101155]|uniref:IPT/TIG domain-containing protein n=1 Tax=Kitasatospora sp. NPDC101155 TaxID=3364097 RepID=UPI00382FF937